MTSLKLRGDTMRWEDKINSSVRANVFSGFSRFFKHLVNAYSFCAAWDSPGAEGLEEGAGRCQEAFQSCDLWQVNRTLCHLHQMCYQENTFPEEASTISIHLRWGKLSLCSSVRAFLWQRPVLLGPSGQPCLHRYLMSDRQQWWVPMVTGQRCSSAS